MDYFSKIHDIMEPEPKESPFEIGEWVQLTFERKSDPRIIRGYVLKNDGYAEKSFVQAVWSNIPDINSRNWVKWENLINLEQETDPNILIDLALATRDEEWFTQLTRGME